MPAPKTPIGRRPVQPSLFEKVPEWKKPAGAQAARRRKTRLPRPQMWLFEEIHLDRLMPRLLSNEVIFKTAKLKLRGKTKTISVAQEVRKCLASILRMHGVDADALVGLLVEGKKGGLFIAQTQAQIVGMMKKGEKIGGVQYIPVRPAARAEAENKTLNGALARIAMFVQRAVVAKLARERYGRANLRLPRGGR